MLLFLLFADLKARGLTMNLETVVDFLVVIAGLVGWVVFLPQIQLLLLIKRSDNISLGMVWGSFAIQSTILFQGILKENWPLVLVMMTSLICLSVILFLIYRYRKWPGGNKYR